MDTITLARIFHLLAVVLWIGGVAMVTTVLIPAVKRMKSKEEQLDTFEKIEGRFALQARVTTIITGITGFFMIYKLNAWERYTNFHFWWIHGMTIVWFIFSIILFVLEPLVLHKLFRKYATQNPEKAFAIIHRAHWILLLLSLITIAGLLPEVMVCFSFNGCEFIFSNSLFSQKTLSYHTLSIHPGVSI